MVFSLPNLNPVERSWGILPNVLDGALHKANQTPNQEQFGGILKEFKVHPFSL